MNYESANLSEAGVPVKSLGEAEAIQFAYGRRFRVLGAEVT